jgi:hypothetical protein
VKAIAIFLFIGSVAYGQTATKPATRPLTVRTGETVVIRADASYATAFRFSDGKVAVGWTTGDAAGAAGRWSDDGGRTWRDGPAPPGEASVELDKGEILSLGFATKRRPDGKYTLPQRRSLDGWKTVVAENGVVDVPESVPTGGDGGETNEGFLLDHSVLRLRDGRLMATMYGNYATDRTPADDYPASMHFNKYRTIVVFSSDKGKTWGSPVTVATAVPAMQEGPCEAALARAADGDILCAMRSGGLPGKSTPCYVSRSSDDGQTWSKPVVALDRGVWPTLCVLKNGLVAMATGRPGNWLVLSQDDGRTWEGAIEFAALTAPATSSYNTVLEVAPNTLLVVHDRQSPKDAARREVVGTFFTVER